MCDMQVFTKTSTIHKNDQLRYCASKLSIPKQASSIGIIPQFKNIVTEYGTGEIGYYYYILKDNNTEKQRKFETNMIYYMQTKNEDHFYFNFPFSKFRLENTYTDEQFEELPIIDYEKIYEEEQFEAYYNACFDKMIKDSNYNDNNLLDNYNDKYDMDDSMYNYDDEFENTSDESDYDTIEEVYLKHKNFN